MVLNFYKLREQPFGVTPDARYLYFSDTHKEALASLLYGISAGRGFVALIAKPGMGKTTLLFQGLDQLRETAQTVFLFQTICTPLDFLHALLLDLGCNATGDNLIELQSRLNKALMEQSRSGKRLVLFIDEAQNLDNSVFELVRMLSNFETPREKLLQIILSGQPQLADKLASPGLVQLRQRVSIIAHLEPFSPEDTRLYVDHRLKVAGYGLEQPLFTNAALALIAQHSGGVPRNINNICFNSLSLGCALQRSKIDRDIVLEVVADLDLGSLREKSAIAVPAGARAEQAPPLLTYASAPRSTLARGILRVAAVLAVLFALSWALLRVRETRSARVQANTVASHPDPGSQAHREGNGNPPAVAPSPVEEKDGELPPLSAAQTTGDTKDPLAEEKDVDASPNPVHSGTQDNQQSANYLVPTGVDFEQPRDQAPRQVETLRTHARRHPRATVSQTRSDSVRVKRGQTLTAICVQEFGECNPRILQQIRRLNPWLNDPDQITPGQMLRVPL